MAIKENSRTRVKICGITRLEDGITAAYMGADAIGLVFYPKSPRVVSIELARDIVRALPPFVSVVALFVNAEPEFVDGVLKTVPIDLLQFHGEESAAQCEAFNRPYIKAVPMQDGVDLDAVAGRYSGAQALLLDTYRKGVPGGTGETFNWSRVPAQLDKPVILAGGLTPENVAEAIHQVRPFAVDVSGGVESGKGIKDAAKIAAFMRGVNQG